MSIDRLVPVKDAESLDYVIAFNYCAWRALKKSFIFDPLG